jgi:hypothetical protein
MPVTWHYNRSRSLYIPAETDPGTALTKKSSYMRVPIGWAELFPDDEPTTFERVKKLAQQLNCESVLYQVSLLQLMMGLRRPLSTDAYVAGQMEIAKELFPEDLFDRVRLVTETTIGDTVATSEQLLLAALLAIHHGKAGPRSEWNQRLGSEFLLRLLDLFDITEGQGDRDALLHLVLRRVGAFPNDQERYLLGRYFDVFVKRARAKWGNPSPFDRIFVAAKGYAIEEYLGLGMLLIHPLIDADTVPKLTQIGFDRVVSTIAAQLAAVPHAKDVEAELVGDIPWFRSHRRTVPSANALALTNMEAFFDKPLIRLETGTTLPISMLMILQRLATGIYWTLFTHEQLRDHGIEDMNSLVGEVFQEYCTDCLVGACATGSAVAVPESEVAGSAQTSKPDLVLVEGPAWIMIETTVSTLSRRTLVAGDVAAFRREIAPDSQMGRKLRQPVTAAQHLLGGVTSHPQLTIDTVTDVYPLVLTLHPFPLHALTRDEISATYTPPRMITSTGGRQVRVHETQLLSAEELEVLEPMIAAGVRLSELFTAKESADPFLKGGSVKNFLFAQPDWSETPNPRMRALLDDLRDTCGPAIAKLAAGASKEGAADAAADQ